MARFPPLARRGRFALMLIACGGFPAAAQQGGKEEDYRIITSAEPPRGESSDAYIKATEELKLQREPI